MHEAGHGEPPRASNQPYPRAAAAVLLLGVLGEVRLLVAGPWAGFEPKPADAVTGALAILWVVCAIAFFRRAKQGRAGTFAWIFAFAGPLSMLMHGALTRIEGSAQGLLYILAAPVLGVLAKRAWDGGEYQSLRDASGQNVT